MCTGSDLMARVMTLVIRAAVRAAICISWTRIHAGSITVCARPVPAYRVRARGEGGRLESERRPECRETVSDTGGGRRLLVVVHETGRNWGVCRCVSAWRTDRRNE